METIDISYPLLGIFYLILIIPILIGWKLKLGNIRNILISVVRMTVQLGLVGLYLEVLFRLNKWWLNVIWLLVMLFAASGTVVRNAGLKAKLFLPVSTIGLAIGIFGTGAILLGVVVRPRPLWDAAYVIPIMGMLLGNCMRGNILALERFYSAITKREREYIAYLSMGATFSEATAPFIREALTPALAPTLSVMATLGIVSLPGMMTGQILGGSSPMTAIKYQIALMVAIFTAIVVSIIISLLLSMRLAFNRYRTLKKSAIWKSPV